MCTTTALCVMTPTPPSSRYARWLTNHAGSRPIALQLLHALCIRCQPVTDRPAAMGAAVVSLANRQCCLVSAQVPARSPAILSVFIAQFQYGEDGIDVLQTGFLTRFGFQASNADRFAQQLRLGEAAAASGPLGLAEAEAAVQRADR